jgi:hypothetical protein
VALSFRQKDSSVTFFEHCADVLEKNEIQISCVNQFLVLRHELEELRSGHHAKFANELLRHQKSEPGQNCKRRSFGTLPSSLALNFLAFPTHCKNTEALPSLSDYLVSVELDISLMAGHGGRRDDINYGPRLRAT